MTFWKDNTTFPVSSKFKVEIDNLGPGATFYAKSVNPLPGYRLESLENDAVTMGQRGIAPNWTDLKETRRVNWNPVTIEFVNITVGDQSPMKFFIDLLYKNGYKPTDHHAGMPSGHRAGAGVSILPPPAVSREENSPYSGLDFSAANAETSVGSQLAIRAGYFEALGMVHIHHLKPNGEYASRYHLQNCIISGIDTNGLSYDDDSINTISVTLNYQYCDFWSFDKDQ